jgi:chromosome segregation ATPase
MKIMSSLTALVTATSIGILTGHAWSDETTPGVSAVPAVQTPAPATYPAPDRYRTLPRRGGYAQRWQQPSQWPARPAGYGQMRPYYPPQRQYRAVPAAPAKNPVSTESKQTQEQLTSKKPVSAESKQTQEQLIAKSTELDRAQVTLEQLQLKLQHSRETEHALNEKVAAITGEQQTLQAQVAELQEKLGTCNTAQQQQSQLITNDQQQSRTLTAEHERLRSDLDSRDKQLATVQADLLAATQALQQAQSGSTLSSEQLGTAIAQADTLKNVLTELKARLEGQQTTLQHAETQTAPQAVQQVQPETTTSEKQAVQQAQPETTTSEQQPGAVGSEVAMLHSVLSELKIQLGNTNIRLQDSEQELAACRQDQAK